MNKLSFLFLRLGIGVSMFGHGAVRLPKINQFSAGMVEQFEKSLFPAWIVLPYSYLVPVAEFVIGMLLLPGLFTKQALVAGAILMLTLMLGTSFIENWNALPSQMIHLAYFAVLLAFVQYDTPIAKKSLKYK